MAVQSNNLIYIMSHKFFSALATTLVVFAALFVSCEKEDPNGISKKNAKVTDFLGLYGKTTNDVDAALANFIVEKENYDSDGHLYWVIKTKKDNLRFILDGDEVFATVTFINNVSFDVSLLYNDVVSNGTSLADLKASYGKKKKMGDNWYEWDLQDNSHVSYFGAKLSSGRKSLLIYRKSADSANAPKRKMEMVRKNVGLD